jgi:hypothetical protein
MPQPESRARTMRTRSVNASLVAAPHQPPTTDELLAHLRASRTDLGRFVEAMLRAELPTLVVPASAVLAWQQREPEAWVMVCEWLAAQGKSVRVLQV